MNKSSLGTFVPKIGGHRLQTSLLVFLVTFLLLSVRAYLSNVRRDSFMGVMVEFRTPGQKDPPVFVANSRYIFVDEW